MEHPDRPHGEEALTVEPSDGTRVEESHEVCHRAMIAGADWSG
jgi:hypothetical protein